MDDQNIYVEELDNRPIVCKACGGVMVFEGVGEYHCEDCGQRDYDDYGKVRRHLETNGVCNMTEIAEATGVDFKKIRKMVKESRFAIAADSKTFLSCERCGEKINSGSLCKRCEEFMHKMIEEEERKKHRKASKHIQGGFGRSTEEKGARRFSR